MSNVLEHGVVNALFALELVDQRSKLGHPDQWHQKVEHFYEEKFSKTLGALKKVLSLHISADPALAQVILNLDQCLRKRNYLAHHFWRNEHAVAQSTELTVEKIKELEEMANFFKQFDKELEFLIWPIYKKHGITPEMVDLHIKSGQSWQDQE